jgi:hypothetical protein
LKERCIELTDNRFKNLSVIIVYFYMYQNYFYVICCILKTYSLPFSPSVHSVPAFDIITAYAGITAIAGVLAMATIPINASIPAVETA